MGGLALETVVAGHAHRRAGCHARQQGAVVLCANAPRAFDPPRRMQGVLGEIRDAQARRRRRGQRCIYLTPYRYGFGFGFGFGL